MPRFTYLVFTRCTDAAREEEFNRWYTHSHVPDLSAARGFVGARRFENLAPGTTGARYLCQYEFETDDPVAAVRDLLRLAMEAFAAGRHIDCIEGASLDTRSQAPLLREIDPASLAPLAVLDYPTEPPASVRRAVEAALGA